jgi:Leucine-rich repeat (LRR) protein
MSIADIRAALGISTAPLTCWEWQIAKGISDDRMALQCRYYPRECWLTQAMVDDLTKYSGQTKTIKDWCETKTLAINGNWWSWTNPADGKIHLPNAVRKLTQLTTLNIINYPVEVIDPWIANFTSLENLVILSSKLESLPPSIGSFSKLKKLIISGYDTKAPITTMPDDIVSLVSLEKLAITNTNITQLPTNFEKLNKLTSISLRNNRLTSLPEKIGDISMLAGTVNEPYVSSLYAQQWWTYFTGTHTNKYLFFGNTNTHWYYTGSLDLSGNQLAYLPTSITKLTNLVGIDLSGNPLTWSGALPALPSDFWELVTMQEFVLDNTQIATLPASFSGLTNLRSVVIANNPNLTQLPTHFGMLSHLSQLQLTGNGITSLPESFGDLPVFKSIYPTGPDSILFWDNTYLNLQDNKLESLPMSSIAKFKNQWLQRLDLPGNRMKSFPSNIEDLDTLQQLNLSANVMTGGWVTNLEKVKANYVILRQNQLSAIPNIFGSGSFPNLKILDLTANSLSDLPPSFGQLSTLRNLSLVSNTFTAFPESLTDLVNLDTLSIYGNSIQIVPPSIGKMQGLRTLSFSAGYPSSARNPLISLPKEIWDLVNLGTLAIGWHQLTSLPDSFDKLTKLTSLNLYSGLSNNNLKTLNQLYPSGISKKEYNITPTGQGVKIGERQDGNQRYVWITVGLLACDLLPSEIAELNTLTSSSWSDIDWCTGTASIDLSNKNLSTVPSGLVKLTWLKNIDLSHNQLASIPLFPAMERLNISHNNISSNFGNVPFSGNPMLPNTLKFLDISHNAITYLYLDGTSIQEVQANDNVLNYIPLDLTSLKKVNVANNQITQVNLMQCYIYCWFPVLLNLEQLDISNNRVSSFALTGSQIPKLKYLDLSSNTGAKSLSDLYVSSGSALTKIEAMMTTNDETVTIKSLGDGSPLQITVLPSYANECGITESDLQEIKTIPAFQWYWNYSANKWCSMDKLSLVNHGIPYLPEWFWKLKNLTELDLWGNSLTTLPASLSWLTKLERLSIRQNNFTAFPEVITTLTNLRELYIDNVLISWISGWFYSDMNDTNSFYYNGYPAVLWNQITQIPDSIRNLTRLQKFKLKWNAITDLGDGFAQLPLVGALDLSYNQLSSLPDNFGQLTEITSLRLNNNKLIWLSPTFGNLTNLKELFIKWGNNKLLSLPDNFWDLRNLGFQATTQSSQTLDLSEQALSSLPPGFGQFPYLYELNLSDNNLTSLPPWFGNMPRLWILKIQNTKLNSNGRTIGWISWALPDSFTGMTSIYLMNLAGNDITSLGAFLQSTTWTNWMYLDISDNAITSLPENIGNIRIQSIELHTNKLSTLPDSFSKIPLYWLKLDNNDVLTHLPESFSGMTTLTKLEMNNTAIVHLPRDFDKLRNLVELNIQDGELEDLPDSFGKLPKLERLDLGGNKITVSSWKFW